MEKVLTQKKDLKITLKLYKEWFLLTHWQVQRNYSKNVSGEVCWNVLKEALLKATDRNYGWKKGLTSYRETF